MILPTHHQEPDASTPPAAYRPGQLVRHRRYGYRGVVVDFDMICRAEDGWYYGNQTQPDRNQPWYHVLVDGSSISTYAAQGNLQADSSSDPIDHPLIDHFFSAFRGGAYVRNEAPWPE
ncbi:MAG: heat shock protein HspQ [Phycisphaerae bacterium]|nr:heat shock protein HspQ [Phycisphaerae bacterium]